MGHIPKTISLEVKVWRGKKGDSIHLASPKRFITTVRDDPKSVRGHPHLYGHGRDPDVIQREPERLLTDQGLSCHNEK